MTPLNLIRISNRPWLLLLLALFNLVLSNLCLADQSRPNHPGLQVQIEPQSTRLPIVDAPDNRFVRLTTSDGLSQTKVDHIVQDDQGFMWFGTRYGLYRYDGYAFKVFVRDERNPNSLDGVVVKSLFKDRDGALWIGCDQSLNKFDPRTETFTRYPIPAAEDITQDSAGILWIISPGDGLYSLDPASGRIHHYSHDPNDPSSLSSASLSYCGEDKKGAFWVASDGHLDEFDRKVGKVTKRMLLPHVPGGFKFYEDRFGVFWIFHGPPNALTALDRKNNTVTPYAFPRQEPTMMKVTAMLEDRNGALWIATHGLGLLKLDRDNGRFIRYANVPADPESLPQDKVDELFADREGNIWVAPGRLGPALLPSKPTAFKKLPKVPGATIQPFVGALYEDSQGILWIGTPEALNRFDRKAGRVTAYRTGGPEVGTDVMSIREDRAGYLWIGTYGHGLHRFDRRTGKFKTYRHNPADPYSVSSDFVLRLLVDHDGALWAGTADSLARYDALTDHFTTYKLQKTFFYIELVQDREGKIWIGTESSGLRYFNPATGQLVTYEYDRNRPGTLSDSRVNSVYLDRSGTVWVGTQHGLDKLNPHTGTFTVFTQRDGLPGNAVGCVLEDKAGNLWMSTNNGVARFDSRSKTFTNFSTADGLPGPNLTGWGACFQSPSGEMFFGGFNGGTSFFPNKVADSPYTPSIVLTDFRLSGDPVKVGKHSPLRKSISYATDLVLDHRQNIFSFAFAALSYSSPATNRYRYRLEGLERDWNEIRSDQRQATYTTLPPGRYTFRVQGATRGGPWSEPGVAIRIEILPPWWSTRLFQAAVGALLFLIAWMVYRQRVKQLARQFEARLAERTRIARELHDTLLQNLAGVSLQLDGIAKQVTSMPHCAASMIGHVREQVDSCFREARIKVWNLRSPAVEGQGLPAALGQFVDRIRPATTARCELNIVGRPRPLPPEIAEDLLRIAEEATNNAIRHAQPNEIHVVVEYGARSLRLQIKDDGRGFDLKEGFRKPGHFGLKSIRERCAQIHAKYSMRSAAGCGTQIEVFVQLSPWFQRRAGVSQSN
jgi:signal transduction histidine kinase/ligand-binding sensor domain-containing protein